MIKRSQVFSAVKLPASLLLTNDYIFLHAKKWKQGGQKLIFTIVIHLWISPLRQFVRAGTIDEYDVAMLVPHVRLTSHINCGDVTILNQTGLSDNGEIRDY